MSSLSKSTPSTGNFNGFFHFSFLHVKVDEDHVTSELVQRCQTTKLQIVIICPSLLQHAPGFLMRQLQPILKPERVLGMLLDVTEVKVWEIHKEGELGVFELQI